MPYSKTPTVDTVENELRNIANSSSNYCIPYPKFKTIYQIFQEQVIKTPNKIAVTFSEETITYKELNEKSNQLARHIRAQYEKEKSEALKPGTLITLFLERSMEMIIGVLGVLKAGGAYVPIDPNEPINRMRYLLDDTESQFIITRLYLFDKIKTAVNLESIGRMNYKLHVINLEAVPDNQHDRVNLDNISMATDLAYVIYTSGTTGKPKGVMVEHHSVLNLALSRQNDFSITNSSVVLQFSPLTFDASVCEIFSALLNGATLAVISDREKIDPVELIQFLQTERITVATILPSLLAQLTLSELPVLPELKTLIVAGEPCSMDVMLMWSKGRQLINAYGPSEATVCATVHHFHLRDIPSTIGRPIQNVQVYILDELLKSVPVGMAGEIYISGVGLARGYLNKPELTSERFIDNIFVTDNEKKYGYSKLYKTGDLARWSAKGDIEYIGRNDFQIKIRGHRIELGELENTLMSYPGIKQVCVLARQRDGVTNHEKGVASAESGASKYLVVYYTACQIVKSNKFIDYLTDLLPDYMIPTYYVYQKEFPQTANGKVDRRALPEPEIRQDNNSFVAPSTRLEFELRTIWQDLFGMENIGTQDDFFDIGGDSLLVISLAALINSELTAKVTVSSLFLYRTIKSQSELVLKTISGLKNYQPISTFHSQGKKPALFFVHPSMSGAELYMKMVEWFDHDQPVYGVESYNFNHLDSPETDLKALAKRYIQYIKVIQPNGPYVLGGYSLGGNIAYEIAHQLVSTGSKVDGLYLIDSVLPDPSAKRNDVTYQDAKNFLEYFEFKDTSNKRLLELAKVEMSLLFSYVPKSKLPIKIVLIKAKELLSPLDRLDTGNIVKHFFQVNRPFSGWDQYAKEVNRYEIDANHETIVESSHLEKVARIIQKEINSPKISEMLNSWS